MIKNSSDGYLLIYNRRECGVSPGHLISSVQDSGLLTGAGRGWRTESVESRLPVPHHSTTPHQASVLSTDFPSLPCLPIYQSSLHLRL